MSEHGRDHIPNLEIAGDYEVLLKAESPTFEFPDFDGADGDSIKVFAQ